MSRGEPVLPEPRCLHQVKAVTTTIDGWVHSTASEDCGLCKKGAVVLAPYRISDDVEATPEVVTQITYSECDKPGCCLTIITGEPHTGPCLDPDILAKEVPKE